MRAYQLDTEQKMRATAVALALTLVVASLGCGGPKPAEPASLVPADAEVAVLLPSLAELRGPLLHFLDGIEGAQGGLDWLEQRYGVALAREDGLAEMGIDPRAAAAIFFREGRVHVVFGTADAELLLAKLATRLRLFGYGDPVVSANGATIFTVEARPGASAVPPLAYGVKDGAVAVVVGLDAEIANGAAATDAVAQTLAGPKAPLIATARFMDIAGSKDAVRVWLDLERTFLTKETVDAAVAPLGFFGGALRPLIAGFDRAALRLELADGRATVRLRVGRREGAQALPADWWQVPGDGAAFGNVLPSSTSALLRLSLDLRKVAEIPSFVRNMVLSQNPFAGWHPYAERLDLSKDLLANQTGHVGIAVLGLSDGASLGSIERILVQPTRAYSELHLALLAQVRDPAAFAALMARRAGEAKAAGVKGEALPEGDGKFPAFQLVGGRMRNLGVALVDDIAVVTIGRGELERLLRAAGGGAPTLVQRARTELDRGIVSGDGTVADPFAVGTMLASHISFDRVARQLQCKGFPPYFLKIVTSPDVIALSLDADDKGATLTVEVSQ